MSYRRCRDCDGVFVLHGEPAERDALIAKHQAKCPGPVIGRGASQYEGDVRSARRYARAQGLKFRSKKTYVRFDREHVWVYVWTMRSPTKRGG